MVMSTETTRNTNGRSKSPTNGITNKPAANNEPQLTPETSDDESRKSLKSSFVMIPSYSTPFLLLILESKKNLGKKNGKSEFEGESIKKLQIFLSKFHLELHYR